MVYLARGLHGALASVHLQLLPFHLLLGHLFLLGLRSSGLGKGLLLLDKDNLDVAGRGHIGVDPTVGSVGSPPHLGSPIDLDVVDDKVIGIKTLVLRVGLGILQQVQEKFSGFLRPATLRGTMNLGLGMATYSSHVASEWDNLFLAHDVFQVSGGPVQRHLLDSLSGLTGVLK